MPPRTHRSSALRPTRTSVYVAVIGDIVGSRKVARRAALQRQLENKLNSINNTYAPAIASRFVLTVGDEFQGLLKQVDILAALLAKVRIGIHPVEVRFGIGLGELTTPLRPTAIGMDGPCLHRARKAIERAGKRITPIEVETEQDDQFAFSIYALLYGHLRKGWTERQRQVYDLHASGLDGKDIAEHLCISASAVSQHLRATGAEALTEATNCWAAALRRACENHT